MYDVFYLFSHVADIRPKITQSGNRNHFLSARRRPRGEGPGRRRGRSGRAGRESNAEGDLAAAADGQQPKAATEASCKWKGQSGDLRQHGGIWQRRRRQRRRRKQGNLSGDSSAIKLGCGVVRKFLYSQRIGDLEAILSSEICVTYPRFWQKM